MSEGPCGFDIEACMRLKAGGVCEGCSDLPWPTQQTQEDCSVSVLQDPTWSMGDAIDNDITDAVDDACASRDARIKELEEALQSAIGLAESCRILAIQYDARSTELACDLMLPKIRAVLVEKARKS